MVINTDVVIANKNILYINSKDTTWLKINADGDIANGIDVHGSLKIYSQIKKAKYIQKKGGFHISCLIGRLISLERRMRICRSLIIRDTKQQFRNVIISIFLTLYLFRYR
jgi:hypothetical protein